VQALLYQNLLKSLKSGVDDGVFYGGACGFFLPDDGCFELSAGRLYSKGGTVSNDTLFDIASLTKLFITFVVLKLVDEGRVSLNRPLKHYVTLPADSVWNSFTFEMLLAHETGLPAWIPFFKDINIKVRGSLEAKELIINRIFNIDCENKKQGTATYSDLGFIGIGAVLSDFLDMPLENIVDKYVNIPLGLTMTAYRPLDKYAGKKIDNFHPGKDVLGNSSPVLRNSNIVFADSNSLNTSKENTQTGIVGWKLDIAATEICPWRKKMLMGEVHDDNAWTMGGVAGHAGIFSTAGDICKFGRAWLDSYMGRGLLSEKITRKAFKRRPSGRGLGFDLKSPENSSAGMTATLSTVGHLGFTGTSLWIDPEKQAVISLLTNRVYPTRENILIRRFRPVFNELFFANH